MPIFEMERLKLKKLKHLAKYLVAWTRSGLLQLRELLGPLGGGGGGGHSVEFLRNILSMIGGSVGPYSSSSLLLHLDMEELQETDLTALINSISPGTM